MPTEDPDWLGASPIPLPGGYSGETFVSRPAGAGQDPVVVRIYRRQPDRAAVDASLLRLVRGLLPVPAVVEVRPPTRSTPAVLVSEYLDGVRLDELLAPDPPGVDLQAVGASLGRALAVLSGIPFLRFGLFADAELRVSTIGVPADLTEWAHHFRDTGRLSSWSEPDWTALLDLVDDAEGLMAGDVGDRFVLTHSDFNPKNLLVDTQTGDLIGVLDWEFAHAGSPYADFGNLTRFERRPDFVDAVVAAFVADAPPLADNVLDLGRAADLWALVELAGGTPTNAVRELATVLLLAQARTGDLHAWPWDTPRVDPLTADAVP